MKKVMIFGSTGSIGESALDVIRRDRKQFQVLGLCAYNNAGALLKQVKEFSPRYVCLAGENLGRDLAGECGRKGIEFLKGESGIEEFSQVPCDISVMGISGISCLKPLLRNVRYASRIALANKEAVITAGKLIFDKAKFYGTQIIPVDSEINALFQLSGGVNGTSSEFSRIYITASGGPLLDYSRKDLEKISVKKVLSHPTWKMGRRITVDSATLVNKGFEVVEAHYFFGVPYEKIDVVVHRQSLVHAMVEFSDNTIMACMYPPDMRLPISFALYYPQRRACVPGIKFSARTALTFEPVDFKKFSLLKIVLEAGKKSGAYLAAINACDETAVDYFLKGRIKFTDIYKVIPYIFNKCSGGKIGCLNDVLYWDAWARRKTGEYLDKI